MARRPSLPLIAGGVAIVLASAAITVVIINRGGSEPAAATVATQPVGQSGADPFADALRVVEVSDFPTTIRPTTAGTDATTGTKIVTGTDPNVYAGIPQELLCDTAQLGSALSADPAKAKAWAATAGAASPDGIGDYLATLTPVVLTADTWVTSFQYVGGAATPQQVILERGTSVLVDASGAPAVKCGNGNPLEAPQPDGSSAPSAAATPWDGYDPGQVTTVKPGDSVDLFKVVDVNTGKSYDQPVGGTLRPKDLELRPDGLGAAHLGDDEATVVAQLSAELGDPDLRREKTYGAGCQLQAVWWGWSDVDTDSLTLEFDPATNRLVKYTYTNSGPDHSPRVYLATPKGVTAGSPTSDVTKAYPGGTRKSIPGGKTEIAAGGYVFTEGHDQRSGDPYIEIITVGAAGCGTDPGTTPGG